MSSAATSRVMGPEELQSLFTSEAERQMSRLKTLAGMLAGQPDVTLPLVQEMREIVHILKGQGSSFGYPLLTRVGDLLSQRLKRLSAIDGETHEVLAAHVEVMDEILARRIQGDGGPAGAALLARLQSLPG